MNIEDLIGMYDQSVIKYGETAYKHISELLGNAREQHSADYLRNKPNGDADQSWRAFKGKNLEKLIFHVIGRCIENIGLRMINGNEIGGSNLNIELGTVKRNVLIDYGEFGCHLPDVDLIIYNPKNYTVIAIISSKVTLRERVAQTGYWKFKLKECPVTRHINVLFVTLDEDSTLTRRTSAKKGRAIAEADIDGTYVLTTDNLETSNKVKLFESFIDDLKEYSKRY